MYKNGWVGALALEALRAVLLHTTGQIRGTVVVLCLGHVTVERATGARMRGRARGLVSCARAGWLGRRKAELGGLRQPRESCLCFGCQRVDAGEAENAISISSFPSLSKRCRRKATDRQAQKGVQKPRCYIYATYSYSTQTRAHENEQMGNLHDSAP